MEPQLDFSVFDQFDEVPVVKVVPITVCCGKEMMIDEVEAFIVCFSCGSCVQYYNQVVDEMLCCVRYRSIYQPIKHFGHKLAEITGNLILQDTLTWRRLFEGCQVETIYDVRNQLKKKKRTKLNKYAYYFYKELTGKTVWNLLPVQLDELRRLFMVIHIKFRKKRKPSTGRTFPATTSFSTRC
jgi:hypothetical protein